MLSLRALSTVSIFGLLVTLAGCSGAGTANGADTAVVAQDNVVAQGSSTVGRHMGGRGGRGGPDFLLRAALHEPSLNLTEAQKATIKGALEANKPAAPSFDKSRAATLAAAIRSGNVTETAMKQAPSADKIAERKAASAKALETLHATLTPEQRKALVDAVSNRGGEHNAKHVKGEKGERAAHAGKRGEGRKGGEMGMLKGLDLTQAQQDQIHAKLEAQKPAKPTDEQRAAMKTQFESMKTAMNAKLQTFASDNFDATAFVTPPAGVKPMEMGRGGRGDKSGASRLAIITSVLTPAQRETLAKRIEAGPPAGGREHGKRIEKPADVKSL